MGEVSCLAILVLTRASYVDRLPASLPDSQHN